MICYGNLDLYAVAYRFQLLCGYDAVEAIGGGRYPMVVVVMMAVEYDPDGRWRVDRVEGSP